MGSWREEQIGDCRLICADCRDVLPTLGQVDAVVTDPPYGVDGGVGGDARKFGKADYKASWPDTEEYIANVVVPIVIAALARADRGAVTPGSRCLHLYPKAADVGCFWSPAAVTHGKWGFTNFQPILYYGVDIRAGIGSWPSGRLVVESAEKHGHPCAKPELAWTWLIAKTSRENETLLDPFCGSGTTGVVCAKSDRSFIGIEIEPKYFDIACRRIEAAYAQPRLFSEPSPKPHQEALFDTVQESGS